MKPQLSEIGQRSGSELGRSFPFYNTSEFKCTQKKNEWGKCQDLKQKRILNPQVILTWNEFTVGKFLNKNIQKISVEP